MWSNPKQIELKEIVEAWPRLPKAQRLQIVNLIAFAIAFEPKPREWLDVRVIRSVPRIIGAAV